MNKALFFLIVVLFTVSSARGQRADFSGAWVLQKRISISGNDYVNRMPARIKITQNTDSIFIQKKIMNQNGIDFVHNDTAPIGGILKTVISPDRLKRFQYNGRT